MGLWVRRAHSDRRLSLLFPPEGARLGTSSVDPSETRVGLFASSGPVQDSTTKDPPPVSVPTQTSTWAASISYSAQMLTQKKTCPRGTCRLCDPPPLWSPSGRARFRPQTNRAFSCTSVQLRVMGAEESGPEAKPGSFAGFFHSAKTPCDDVRHRPTATRATLSVTWDWRQRRQPDSESHTPWRLFPLCCPST